MQRNSKFVILGNLGITVTPTHTHKATHPHTHTPKMIVSISRNLSCLFAGNKSTLSFTFSLRYCKDTASLLFKAL